MKKQLAIVLLLVFALTCCWGLTACNGNAKAAIEGYRLDQDESTVSKTFELPAEIGGIKAKWTSSNSNLVKITAQKKADYVVTITRPESERTAVTLTLKLGSEKRDFVVYVNPLDVYDFQDSYAFPYEKAALTEDIPLETSYTYQGKTATIKWGVHTDSVNYIAINAAGNKCEITPPGDSDKIVQILATFTYNGESTTKSYRMTVIKPVTHEEEVNKWYTNTGVSMDIKGWVLAIADKYSSSYKNISFYMIDEDLCCGHYIYRGKCADDAVGAKVVPGAFITLTGSTNTSYHGLYETNSNGTITVDDSKKIDLATTDKAFVYALDNDLFSGTPTAVFNQSRYVSLTNWKVTKVEAKPTALDAKTLFTIEKNGVSIDVCLSKYMAGSYASADDAEFKAIVALCDTVKVNDIVSVKGFLTKYDNDQIALEKASDVKVEAAGDAAGTTYPGVTVKPVITDIKKDLDSKLGKLITSATEITLPTSSVEGVTVEYSIINGDKAQNVTLANGKLKFDPKLPESVTLRIDVKCGDYATVMYYTLTSRTMSDADMVEAELAELDDIAINFERTVDLQAAGKTYTEVEITWAKKDSNAIGTLADGKYTITEMPDEDTDVVLVATATLNGESNTKEVTVTVKALSYTMTKVTSATVQENKAYKLVFDNTQENKRVFVKNETVSTYYVASSETPAGGDDIYVEKVTGGVKLYFKDAEGKKNYLGAVTRDGKPETTSYNIKLDTETVWTIEDNCIKTNLNPDGTANEVFLGNYGKNTSFNVSKLSYLETSYAAYLVEVTPKVEAEEGVVKIVFDSLTASNTALTAEKALSLVKEKMDSLSDKLTSVSATNVYPGSTSGGAYPDNADNFLKLGKSKADGKLVLTFDEGTKFSKVEIKCHDYYKVSDDYPTTSDKVKVNNVEKGVPYNANGTGEVLTFDLATASNEITIECCKDGGNARIVIFEIILYVAE